ncbi:hypothetical protein F5Y19DRAFT_476397 [Xylariaceae sp. FL1651]|nr:hypothetical protein F5Y19DRAFT_476397 [Xylariaceae sp. FL1651]
MLIEYKEFASPAMLTNDNRPKQAELLMIKYNQDQDSERYKKAREFFDHLLSSAAMLKLYHWREHDVPTLTDFSHFTQDREISLFESPAIRENVLVAGVLETFDS